MPNKEEQEKTKIYSFDELDEMEKQDVYEENQVIEMEENTSGNVERPNMDFFMKPQEELPKEKNKKPKKPSKIKVWWQKRSKKQKIIFLSVLILVVIAIGIGVFFVVKTRQKPVEEEPPTSIIIEEENYRYENGVLVFLNSAKEEIGRYTCKNQNENLCFISYFTVEDTFDTEKKLYEDNSFVRQRTFVIEDKYVFINDNPNIEDKTILLYNIEAEKEEGLYETVKKINKDHVILKNTEGKYGVVAFTKESFAPTISFNYEFLGAIEGQENVYVSIEDGRNLLIDETGKNISKAINGAIKNINKSYIKAKQDTGGYEVYNYNNQNVFNDTFDYVELFEDYAILIKENKMYLKYYDKNKLNEEGISLGNKDYVKTSIYGEDGKLMETKQAFSVEETNNAINLSIYKESDATVIQINKNEGLVSKNLKNMNYFDGKLYIYRDSAKTDLLGTYTCANKNNITGNASKLNNCSLAKDTIFEDNDYEIPGAVGTIPVFNERFIFINDNPELVNDANKTIVLYDLKKSSSLGKYAAINTYSYTGTEEISFSTVNDLQVVAKNQSGRFGVIKIGLSEISGHISFNYSEMESLRDYYVAKDANGYLLISKNNGASITSAIPYKIRNYTTEYVKVINGGNYYVYDLKGKQITEATFKYIELYNHFFIGVTPNNKLELYDYNYPKRNELDNIDTTLTYSKYYGNGTLAFKASESGYNYEVFIAKGENTYESVAKGQIEHEER